MLGGGAGRRVETELPPSNTKTFYFTSLNDNEGVEGGISTVTCVSLIFLSFLFSQQFACFQVLTCIPWSASRLDMNAALVLLDEFLLDAKTWE